ncbi:hypothetical_protein [Leishmania infantum]|uniref:Hypothetical_protein n=1 Tax=Leishmania infantum TaxID=5671 RepID=A0A6L0XUM2_LEIIN|nr:hypothetical_protein [Leishmania infantum]SUZ43656.1 hypothetical_protein [Leishmania infantum]
MAATSSVRKSKPTTCWRRCCSRSQRDISGRAPAAWKEGLTAPLLKPHRPDGGSTSYRPCSADQRSMQATRTNDRVTTAQSIWATGSSHGILASRAHRSTTDPVGLPHHSVVQRQPGAKTRAGLVSSTLARVARQSAACHHHGA